MDGAAAAVLFALLIAFVGDAAASCRQIANDEMLEYLCEGGNPVDLTVVPETTEKLRIVRMPLGRITADTFARFGGNLWVLSCSHCEIADIDENAFRRLVNLQQLSLDSNRLTAVQASWFVGLNYLTYLDLNYNEIRDIEDGVYGNLPSLVDLRISGNRLRCLNLDAMSHLKELKRMFLSENAEFVCPHAVSKFLEDRGVAFEQDPEWRRLVSDAIDVHVPPSFHAVEDDRETVPMHRERLHPDRKPPPVESEGPTRDATRDKGIYPNHSETHRSRHRRPTTTTARPTKQQEELPVPRVEPRPDVRISSHVPSESSSSSHRISYSTPETPRAPPSEDIRMSVIDESSQTEHTAIYPPHPTHETTPHWPYPTPERAPPIAMTSLPLSEDTEIAGTNRPPQTDSVPTSYIPMRETMPDQSYPIPSERPRLVVGSITDDRTIDESERLQSQMGNTRTYPLYVTTSDGLEETSHGSVQVIHPSSGNSDMVTFGTTDGQRINPWSSWLEHHEAPFIREYERTTWPTKTPYGQDPRKMIVDESSLVTDDDLFVATDRPVQYPERSTQRTTMTSDVHYVRPSPVFPERGIGIHAPSTDEFYQAPRYEPTVHPPELQNYYQEGNEASVRPIETMTSTTDKPLPECPENSASKPQPAVIALLTFIAVAVLGHAVRERF